MPIFFKPSASDFSLSADSIGNRWLQAVSYTHLTLPTKLEV